MTRTQLAVVRDGAMARLGGESRYAGIVSHHLVTLYNFGVEPLRRFAADAKGPNGRVLRALVAAYDEEQ